MLPESPPDSSSEACSPAQMPGTSDMVLPAARRLFILNSGLDFLVVN